MNQLTANLKKSNGRLIDETGNKYNKLTVIKYAGSGKKYKGGFDGGAAWHCKCDCGNNAIVLGTRLRMGIVKSCGCTQKKAYGEGSFNAMYVMRKHNAKIRGIEWKLSKKEVKKISKQPCAYCGLKPSNVSRGSSNGDYVYSGIDRINSEKSYEPGNTVPCCIVCNKAKSTQTVSEFLDWIKRMSVHNNWGIDIKNIKFKDVAPIVPDQGFKNYLTHRAIAYHKGRQKQAT